MNRWKIGALMAVGMGAALTGWLELFRRSRQSRCLVLHESVAAGPEELFERLCEVEAEPTLIPGVHAVTVLGRGDTFVRYRVEGHVLKTPWWAVFHKEWERAPHTLTWESEEGTLAVRQVGQVDLQPAEGGTRVSLVTCTHFDAPVLGPIATLTAGPLYLQHALHAWVRNAARAAATRRHWEQLLSEPIEDGEVTR